MPQRGCNVMRSSTHICGRVSPVKRTHRSCLPAVPAGKGASRSKNPSAPGAAGSGTLASVWPLQPRPRISSSPSGDLAGSNVRCGSSCASYK